MMNTDKQNKLTALDRYLSPLDVWAMAFGVMVGWGAFVMPGTTFVPVAGPAGTIIALLIGTLIMLVIGTNFVYLMIRSTRTGGVYSYTKEAFGRDHAFLSSWFLCLSYLTVVFLNGSAVFVVIKTLFGEAVHKGVVYSIAGNDIYFGEIAASVAALGGIALLFIAAKPALQKIHTICSVILIAGVAVLSVFCLPKAFSCEMVRSFGTQPVNKFYGIFSIVILAPWAFVGFEVTSFDTAHFKFNIKKTRTIIFIAIIAAALAYGAMTLVAVASLPEGYASWPEYINDLGNLSGMVSVPTFYAARTNLGSIGPVIIGITALAAIMTGIIGAYRASLRILSTMAEDRILSEKFSKTTYSILFIMVISILISLLGRNTLIWFVDLTSFGAIVGYGYTSAAAWKIAKAENNKKNTLAGAVGTIISALFVVVQLVPRLTAMEAMGSEAFLLLALWCLLGFLFYWRTVIHSTLSEYSGISASGIVLFIILVYSSLMWIAKQLAAKETIAEVHSVLVNGGIVALGIIFTGLVVMLYVQKLVRTKHEAAEREKIRAVESSLAKSRFLFNISHDIRTPMNAIIGYTILAQREPSSPVVHDYLTKIENSNKQLLALINDILEMSRIENGKFESEYIPADITASFDEMRDLFSEQMKEKGIEFSVHTSGIQNRYVWYDKKSLNRILLNLLSNAYKFTPKGGTVSAALWETGNGENGYTTYEIRVQDNGIGMSAEFSEKMFTAFERERTSTDSGIEGTGLGLSITKSLVDLMGGTIEVLTAPGNGTVFIIRIKFRLADEKEVRAAARTDMPEEEEEPFNFSQKRVLLAEDNEINKEIAVMILEQEGFTVETADNGKAAVEAVLAAGPGHYDLILMDIQIPVMDGYEAARAIRSLPDQLLAGIPIIAMTANAFKEDETAAIEAGMQAHIAKPLDVEKMMKTIGNVMKKGS